MKLFLFFSHFSTWNSHSRYQILSTSIRPKFTLKFFHVTFNFPSNSRFYDSRVHVSLAVMVAAFCVVNFLLQQDYQCNFPVMWNTLTKLGSKCLKRFSIFHPKSSQDSSLAVFPWVFCVAHPYGLLIISWFFGSNTFPTNSFLFLCISLLHQLVFFLKIPTLDFLHTLVDVFKSIVLKILLFLPSTFLPFS